MTTLAPRSLARLALPALAAALLAAPLAGQRTERFSLEGRSATVHNLAGEITVASGTGNAVVVEVTRGGPDAARLSVNRDGGTLRIAYPGERVIYPRMGARARFRMDVRRDGTLRGGFLGSREVTVAGTGTGTQAWADLRVLVPAGHAVNVHLGAGGVQVTNVNGRVGITATNASVRTQGTRGGLTVRLVSGTVDVRDAVGNVMVGTGSGAVTMANVRGTTLDVDTRQGGVRINGVRVQRLDVGVSSGGASLLAVQAREVTVESGNGPVTLGLTSDADLELDTGAGAVTVSVPPAFGAQVEIETGNGGITVDVPATDRRTTRNTFMGRVGDGNGTVEIWTGSGAVRIRRN
jgi:hypothetical protein